MIHAPAQPPTLGDDGRAVAGMIGAGGFGIYAWAMNQPASTVIGAVGVVTSMLIPLIQPIVRDWVAGREARRRELAASQDVARNRELEELHARLMEKLEIIKRQEGDLTALREYYLIERRAWAGGPPMASEPPVTLPVPAAPPTSEGPA